MNLRLPTFLFISALLTLGACVENQSQLWQQGASILNSVATDQRPLTTEEIGRGLKEALKVSTGHVVFRLGQPDGFNLDPTVHIPLPKQLDNVKSVLEQFGLATMLVDLELKLNQAAEKATPKAKQLFWQAIRELSFTDIMSIYQGPDDAATRYFQTKMSSQLVTAMRPVVAASLHEVSAVRSFDRAIAKYRTIPLVPEVKADLTVYVIDKAMAGIFHYIALEEQAIRRNPAKRTTELLRRVFGL